jgi:hypothetical protein
LNIEQIFYGITTAITLVLTVFTLQRLISGWWRQYYLLALILVLTLAGVVPPIASFVSNGNWSLPGAQRMYWALALCFEVTIFLFVLQLIYRIGRESPHQASLIRFLTLASLVAAGISVVAHLEKRPNIFMASVTRDLTFMAAILNMILWRFILQLRKRDFLILSVSAGLGIQCTGDALGHSLRILARQIGSATIIYEFGNVLISLAAVLTIAIWRTAFSRRRFPAESGAGRSLPVVANTHESSV